jgi:hypothetical protein
MHIDERTENQGREQRKKDRRRKHYVLKFSLLSTVGLLVTLTIISIFLLHKPSDYQPPQTIENGQVSKYLTHVISQDLYNGAQAGVPFDLVVTEEGIADVIARSAWPKQAGEALFSVPEVKFLPDSIVIRGLVDIDMVELFVVVEGTSYVDEQGLLYLHVTKVKIGAVSVTTVAKMIAGAIYNSESTSRQIDRDDWRARIMTALLLDEPFEPVFEIEDAEVRIDDVKIESGKLTIHFVPVNPQDGQAHYY